ncbi:hypothetical protein E1A91_A05G364300v1 [Gossypium mustelinum]|uniref:Inactive shikimate kinase like 1, chloroplastic n=1 Tax=Gossypium mustelinum TaxID=34275 RepID=A0A5D2ZG60_GOSMU|nr:hypothetical protein E1A91_A05G364300v1 [Gossypium mustelinum]
MEMTTILHSSLTNPPFTAHLSPSKFPRSFSTPFRLRTSLSFSPSLPPKSFPTNCSVSDDTTSSANVASVDLSIALKKKATDVSADLRGNSIFLVGMNNSVKSSLGMLLADLFRYYYFDRALLRHGISIWIDVPLEMLAKGIIGNKSLLLSSEITISGSYSEVLSQLMALYEDMRRGYATADATVSLQKVAYQLGYEDMDAVTTEDITMEVLKEIERLTRVKKMMEAAARPF